MPVHRIHLKGPWEFAWLSTPSFVRSDVPENSARFLDDERLRMPVEWRAAFGPRAGTVEFRRRFQWPTNLDPGETAHLVFDGVGGTGDVSLNGEPLGTLDSAPASFEITVRLRSTNLLVVMLTFDPQTDRRPGGLWGPVALAIHEMPPSAADFVDP